MVGFFRALRLLVLLLISSIGALMLSCDGGSRPVKPPRSEQVKTKLRVVSTTPLIHEIVTRLAGDKVDAICLLRPGEALDEPTLRAGDTTAMREADLILLHGTEQEAKILVTIKANAKPDRIQILAAIKSEPATASNNLAVPSFAPVDQHALIERVTAILLTLTPSPLSDAEKQSRPLHAEVEELTTWMKTQLAATSPEHRIVLTDDALAASIIRGSGLEAVVVDRLANAVPTQVDRQRLLTQIRSSKASVIAIDAKGSETTAEMLEEIARETGAKIVGRPLQIWPTAENGYVAMMKANVKELVAAMKR